LSFLGYFLAKRKGSTKWLTTHIRFIGIVLLLSGVINTLFSHQGKTIIFKLPQQWLIIGGALTLESLTYGLINGLVIAVLFLIFNIINLALSTRQITYLIPKIFYPIAIILTISLTFFPTIQRRISEIKEAQQLRGNQMKKIADWLPIVLPLLISSLERSITLSESMSARGFHPQKSQNSSKNVLIGIILAFFLIFSAWILQLYDYPPFISLILYLTGGISVLLTFFIANRKISVTRFYQEKWKLVDIFASIFFAIIIFILVILEISGCSPQFTYSPYPVITQPLFNIGAVLLNLTLLLPLIAILSTNCKENDPD
jgi:energy-coupling factor transport system permease protein